MSLAVQSIPAHQAIDTLAVRRDFPIFDHTAPQAPLHYLDNAATTHKPSCVIEALTHSYGRAYGPIHRGLYPLAERASGNFESARETLQQFIGAGSPGELVFTRSATEAINMVAQGWLKPRLDPGDIVWVSRMEHHSNYLPWQRACRERQAELRIIELTGDGQLDIAGTPELFAPGTKFIALSHVSNVLGIENPVAAVCRSARTNNIPVLIDAAQSVSHLELDVAGMGCDFLAFSAHKMFGPTGIGLLYGREERLSGMEPLLSGGGMVDQVGEAMAASHWADIPARFEAGSPDMPGAVAFAAAADYLVKLDRDKVRRHVASLSTLAAEGLMQIPGISLLPHPELPRSGIVSFTHSDLHPHDLAQVAGELGVAIRAGHHCAQPLLNRLGHAATARASFSIYNDRADVDALIEAILTAQRMFSL
jgi:cysteine desulfurase/selenocysteine lyase